MADTTVNQKVFSLAEAQNFVSELNRIEKSDRASGFQEADLVLARSLMANNNLIRYQGSITARSVENFRLQLTTAIKAAVGQQTECKTSCREQNCDVTCSKSIEVEVNESPSSTQFFAMSVATPVMPSAQDWRGEMRAKIR